MMEELCATLRTAPLECGPGYEMSLFSTHLRAAVTFYTWVLCLCFKYQGWRVTFSCCSGTHSVLCHLMPALFKCLSQHPRSKGKIKALDVRYSVVTWGVSCQLSTLHLFTHQLCFPCRPQSAYTSIYM